ncbi:MAG: hypothetical protein AAFQ78_03345, partial [Bacteroidota bacterium]
VALPWGALDSLPFRMLYGLLVFTCLLIAFFSYQEAYRRLGRKNHALTRLGEAHQASLLQVATEKSDTLQALRGTGVGDLLNLTRELQTINDSE